MYRKRNNKILLYLRKTKDEELPLAEHEEVIDKAVAATCTKEGKTQGSHCDICNKVIIPQETVPKTEHIAVTDKAVAPTCVSSGKTEGSHCSVCKKVLKEQETIAATGKHKLKHIAEKKQQKVLQLCRNIGNVQFVISCSQMKKARYLISSYSLKMKLRLC